MSVIFAIARYKHYRPGASSLNLLFTEQGYGRSWSTE
jgi:hypothetical protein